MQRLKFVGCFSSLPRSSFVCGLAGALASNPVDVVRTRLMNQRGGALYQGTLDCILQVRITPVALGGAVEVPHPPPTPQLSTCLSFSRRGATRASWRSTRVFFQTGSAWAPGTSSYPLIVSLEHRCLETLCNALVPAPLPPLRNLLRALPH